MRNDNMTADFNLLTLKQKKVYSAIETFIKERGIPPTVREIGEMIGEKTPGAVQGILNRLELKGVIKRELGMARSIQIVSDNSQYATHTYIPEIQKVTSRNIEDLINVYNIVKYHPISPLFLDNPDDSFVIECSDASVVKSCFKSGDLLFISRQAEIKDGDIVMIIYDNHTLLRRYFRHEQSNKLILKADSNLLDKEVFNKNEVTIVGKIIANFQKY